MAFRSYMLTNLKTGLEREGVVAVVRELEGMPEVIFAEPTVGAFDLVATVETNEALDELARRIQTIDHVEKVTPLKVEALPMRERMWKNFDKIPTKVRG